MRARRIAGVLVTAWLLAPAAWPLETDQYEAWNHALRDATEALNAKINYELQVVLDRVNGRRGLPRTSCEVVTDQIAAHFRMLRSPRFSPASAVGLPHPAEAATDSAGKPANCPSV